MDDETVGAWTHPDRPFHNLGASKYVAQRFLTT